MLPGLLRRRAHPADIPRQVREGGAANLGSPPSSGFLLHIFAREGFGVELGSAEIRAAEVPILKTLPGSCGGGRGPVATRTDSSAAEQDEREKQHSARGSYSCPPLYAGPMRCMQSSSRRQSERKRLLVQDLRCHALSSGRPRAGKLAVRSHPHRSPCHSPIRPDPKNGGGKGWVRWTRRTVSESARHGLTTRAGDSRRRTASLRLQGWIRSVSRLTASWMLAATSVTNALGPGSGPLPGGVHGQILGGLDRQKHAR
jgi:hypothetical protein